jgi:predicted transcriptional regulator YdeE
MNIQQIDSFNVIGISVRTTNENGQAAIDIPALWGKFISEVTPALIPSKIDSTVYCIYTEYEKDHTKPYTTILGCKVQDLNEVPEGMVGVTIASGPYQPFVAKGSITKGAVYNEWVNIWNSYIERTFTTDFEMYGAKAQNPEDAEVDIFIAVKN